MSLSLCKNPGVSASRHQQYPNYFILDGKIRIGRIYKEEAPTHPELPWFWSLMVRGKGQPNIQGHDATLPQAKAQFEASWRACKT
jgi:hypothetical protein